MIVTIAGSDAALRL